MPRKSSKAYTIWDATTSRYLEFVIHGGRGSSPYRNEKKISQSWAQVEITKIAKDTNNNFKF